MEKIDIAQVFAVYANERRWITWKWMDGKKPPIDTNGRRLKDWANPSAWLPLKYAQARAKRGNGVGITTTADDDLGCVDLDSCMITVSGQREVGTEDAARIIAEFASYTEVSPTEQGVKIFARGLPADLRHKLQCTLGQTPKGFLHGVGVELFGGDGHYVTVTGNHLPSTPAEIRTVPEETWQRLAAWIEEVNARKKAAKGEKSQGVAIAAGSGRHIAPASRQEAARQFLAQLADELTTLDEGDGRNPHLNRFAWRAGSLVVSGDLTEAEVFEALMGASEKNGYIAKKGRKQAEDSLRSGLRAAKEDKGCKLDGAFLKLLGQAKKDDGGKLKPILMSSVVAKPIVWLVPNRIPRDAVTLCPGDPKVGKGFIVTFMVAHLTTGRPWPFIEGDKPREPKKVLWFQSEESLEVGLRPRLDAAGADANNVLSVQNVELPDGSRRGFDIVNDLARLDVLLQEQPDIGLVILDPISEFMGNGLDNNQGNQVRARLGPLNALAERHHVAILAVAHTTKKREGSVVASASGSMQYAAVARSIINVDHEWGDETDDDGASTGGKITTGRKKVSSVGNWIIAGEAPTLIFEIKSKDVPVEICEGTQGETRMGYAEYVGESDDDAQQVYEGHRRKPAARRPSKVEEAMAFIKAAMLDPAHPGKLVYRDRLVKEIEEAAAQAGISNTTLKRAKRELKIDSSQKDVLHGQWWWLAPKGWPTGPAELPF